MFLMGNFIALPRFAQDYGVYSPEKDKYIIVASWQSALQMGGPLGAIMGVLIAGPLTSKIGYRWATISGLMLLNAFIFVFYFAKSLPVMFVAQLLEGIPWGIFIANAPAYCSEITPIQLRAPATQMLQMFWAIGAIIVGGVTFHYNSIDNPVAYRYIFFHFTKQPSLTRDTEFLLRFSGCSPLLSLFFSSSRPSRPGGWSERAVSKRLRSQSPAWDVRAR